MACIRVNRLKRFLSGGSCFHDADELPLLLATGIFNLVCGWIVTIWERFLLLSGRHSPRCEYRRAEIWEAKRR